MRLFLLTLSGVPLGVDEIADLRSQKVASSSFTDETVAFLNSVGAFAIRMPATELKIGLQTGIVDLIGIENLFILNYLLSDTPEDFLVQVYEGGTTIDPPMSTSAAVALLDSLLFEGSEANDTLVANSSNDALRGFGGDDFLDGREGNDDLFGEAGNDTLFGRSGDDYISAGSGHDDVTAGIGDDRVLGGDGDDTLRGGKGQDSIEGNDGADVIRGQSHGDNLIGGDGDDNIKGGGGNDSIEGDAGNDFLKGGTRRDYIDGGIGNDKLIGNSFDDTLEGNAGDDTLNGGGDNDHLLGGRDNDFMKGGSGDDTLSGDYGNDTYLGGSGADVFVFDDQSYGNDEYDVVLDFDLAQDRLSLLSGGFLGMTEAEIAATATVTAQGVEIAHSSGDTILLEGLTSTAGLEGVIDLF